MANITDKTTQIREAVYGKDVRESIAAGIETINSEVESTTARQAIVEGRQDDVENTFQEIINMGSNPSAEVTQARIDTINDVTYANLQERLDSNASQLAQNVQQINSLDLEKADKTEVALKADQAFVDSQFSAIVSGAPKGTYTDLTALQTAYPSGTDGVMLVLADGYWYYWNDTTLEWTSGDVYQPTGIGEESISFGGLSADFENIGDYIPVVGETKTGYYHNGTGVFNTVSSWNTVLYSAIPNSKYQCTGQVKESIVSLVLVFDNAMNLIKKFEAGDGVNIVNYTDYKFTTPAKTAFVAITGRAVTASLSKLEAIDLREIRDNYNQKPIFFKKTSTGLYRILYKYNENYDMMLSMKAVGPNALVQLYTFDYLANTGICNGNFSNTVALQKVSASDWVGPYVVQSVNNADGDGAGAGIYFTGGWHAYDNSQSGVATARTASAVAFADGLEVDLTQNEVITNCKELKIVVTNYIQGNNTTKADGTGREILKEVVTYTFKDGKVYVSNLITALEDILLKEYYGLQIIGGLFNSEWGYISQLPTTLYSYDGVTTRNINVKPDAIFSKDVNGHYVIGSVDNVGLGKQAYNFSSTRKAHGGYSNKSYYDLVKDSPYLTLTIGQQLYWQGWYKLSDKLLID